MNTEYVIIPICIPDNDTDYIKVCGFPFYIYDRDETGRLINIMKAEQEAMNIAAQIYKWKGKISFVYGFGTAGGIRDKEAADKANERLRNKISQFTRIDLMRAKY